MPGQRRPKELVVDAPGEPVQIDGEQVPLRSEAAPMWRLGSIWSLTSG